MLSTAKLQRKIPPLSNSLMHAYGRGFPGGIVVKNLLTRRCRGPGFSPWVRKFPWRRKWQPTPVFLPGEFHGQGRLAGYSPQGCKELDTTVTEHKHDHRYEKMVQKWGR